MAFWSFWRWSDKFVTNLIRSFTNVKLQNRILTIKSFYHVLRSCCNVCIKLVFGRPFVKRFAIDRCLPACLSVLSCPSCLWRRCIITKNGWMDLDETWCGGRPRPQPHCVRWRPSWHSCGQTAGWLKMPLDMGVGIGPGDIVLHGGPRSLKKGHSPQSSTRVYCVQTIAHLSCCWALVGFKQRRSRMNILVNLGLDFTAQRYASAVYAMALRLSVCLYTSVCPSQATVAWQCWDEVVSGSSSLLHGPRWRRQWLNAVSFTEL